MHVMVVTQSETITKNDVDWLGCELIGKTMVNNYECDSGKIKAPNKIKQDLIHFVMAVAVLANGVISADSCYLVYRHVLSKACESHWLKKSISVSLSERTTSVDSEQFWQIRFWIAKLGQTQHTQKVNVVLHQTIKLWHHNNRNHKSSPTQCWQTPVEKNWGMEPLC